MRGSEQVAQVFIIGRVLIGVAHHKADGASCRLAFKHATEQFYLVGLFTAGGDAALSGASAVQFALNKVDVDVDACRHAINDAAHSSSVTFAERGERENISEGVSHNGVDVVLCVLYIYKV